MSSISIFLNSSVGKKVLMSLTGLFLMLFLVIHLLGNLQLLKHDDGYAFNTYAAFMTTNPLIKIVSWGTYFIIIIHAIRGISLERANRSNRTNKYVISNYHRSTHWTARKMGLWGAIILLFIVFHMSDFWWKYKFGETPWTKYTVELTTGNISSPEDVTGQGITKFTKYTDAANASEIVIAKDLYKKVVETFSNIFFVLFYAVSMLAIAFHLWHGFASSFQSLGINHKKYNPLIKGLGKAFSIIIPILFALIPIIMFFTHQ